MTENVNLLLLHKNSKNMKASFSYALIVIIIIVTNHEEIHRQIYIKKQCKHCYNIFNHSFSFSVLIAHGIDQSNFSVNTCTFVHFFCKYRGSWRASYVSKNRDENFEIM